VSLLASFAMLSSVGLPEAEEHYNDFGGVGYFQTPSARMGRQGDFALGFNINSDYKHYTANMLVYPWFSATARYTQVPDVLYSGDASFSGDTQYTDKGLDAKVLLLPESLYLPQVAIGLQDIGGTGLFDGEYLVASKRIHNLDVSVGYGWGYLGQAGSSYQGDLCGRDQSYGGKGGQIDYKRWFKGCSSVFGGASYSLDKLPLSLMIEYDGNDYSNDFPVRRAGVDMSADSRFNWGAIYSYKNFIDLKLSYQRGNTINLGFNVKAPLGRLPQVWAAPKLAQRVGAGDTAALLASLKADAGLSTVEVYQAPEQLTVLAANGKYRNRALMVEQVAETAFQYDENIETVRIIERRQKLNVVEHVVSRNDYGAYANNLYLDAKRDDIYTSVEPGSLVGTKLIDDDARLLFSWSPKFQQSFGGSEGFYTFALGVRGAAKYWINSNLFASGSVHLNLYNNYDNFLYSVPPDGTDVRRVRTLVRDYVANKDFRLVSARLTYLANPFNDQYLSVYGGYLESMFAGVGSEWLYRKKGSNFALGIDANYVSQRDPDTFGGLFSGEYHVNPSEPGRPYRVQSGDFTGHVTAYYRIDKSWLPTTDVKLSVGKFLAGDVGVGVDISREFKSGVTIGAYAAKTDMSSEEFGEGSFNKGFYITVPYDRIFNRATVRRGRIHWAPLTRDGGQKLSRGYKLFDLTQGRALNNW